MSKKAPIQTERTCPAAGGVVEGRASRLRSECGWTLSGVTSQIPVRWPLVFRHPEPAAGRGEVNRPSRHECQNPRRHVLHDNIVDTVEVGPIYVKYRDFGGTTHPLDRLVFLNSPNLNGPVRGWLECRAGPHSRDRPARTGRQQTQMRPC